MEIPVGAERRKTPDLLPLPSDELWHLWEESRDETSTADFSCRGWYYALYEDVLRESNLAVVRKLCDFRDIRGVDFFYMSDLDSLDLLPGHYDVIWRCGSLIIINAPFAFAQRESQKLLEHLNPGGRWIGLGYPKARWERKGHMPFETWGDKTDGGAPWIEWYDLEKMLARLAPEQFRVVFQFSFHNDDFNWFDLQRVV